MFCIFKTLGVSVLSVPLRSTLSGLFSMMANGEGPGWMVASQTREEERGSVEVGWAVRWRAGSPGWVYAIAKFFW